MFQDHFSSTNFFLYLNDHLKKNPINDSNNFLENWEKGGEISYFQQQI